GEAPGVEHVEQPLDLAVRERDVLAVEVFYARPLRGVGPILTRAHAADAAERDVGARRRLEGDEVEDEARRGPVAVAVGRVRMEELQPEEEGAVAVRREPALGALAHAAGTIRREQRRREGAQQPQRGGLREAAGRLAAHRDVLERAEAGVDAV